jgi:3,4-dihydroxy-2-butanone 4-phosphate synthase
MGRVSTTTSPRRARSHRSRTRSRRSGSGRSSVVVDDADRENEGDSRSRRSSSRRTRRTSWRSTAGADLPVPDARSAATSSVLRQMTDQNEAAVRDGVHGLDRGRDGVSTGSRRPTARHTIQVAVDPTATPHDLVHPGSQSSRCARAPAACLKRSGQTEAAVDLARLAGSAGRRRLRDHERRRDDGPRPGSRRVLRAPRAQARHRRRPDRVPAAHREARRARRLRRLPTELRRLPGGRLPRDADRASSTSRS